MSTFAAEPRAGRHLPLVLAVLALGGCAANKLSSNAGVSVQGEPQAVVFGWEADHPWANQFQTQAARLRLYAQYRSRGQVVEQDLGTGSPGGDKRLRFALPANLRSTPEGPVCLFVSASRNAASVPVRLEAAGGDTARFRHAAWDTAVRVNTGQAQAQRELSAAEAAQVERETAYASMRGRLEKEGATTVEACQARSAAPAAAPPLPAGPALRADQLMDGAQRVCVRRTRNMRRFNAEYQIDVPEVVGQAQQQAAAGERWRGAATAFLRDWQRWSGQTGVDYRPEVGSETEGLPAVGTLYALIKAYNKAGKQVPPEQQRALAAGLLDAYGGCVEDVHKQLRLMLQAWERGQRNQPGRDKAYQERQQAECVGRVGELDKLAQDVEEGRRQLARLRGAQAPAPAPQTAGPAAASTAVLLNAASCSP